ncbi:hypothetical protein MNR01_09945 [Lysobacter sp. S4-A87]|uniref:hypothetical protein n=1 Tax=Lysobacter sp. S4-A87 TaxID=2925843 RepID=UPI001F52D539|nr:hypothetical protein [Lysobacter sp. S4-A87]UNK48101.1 hypothetical protein MNR01_09945 [Lysobacter sp. S4-A87]
MNKTLPLLACSLLIAVTGSTLAQQAPSKKLYCWNENGGKVCGDALPAHAVDNARTEFNAKSGRAVSQLPRALTEEERAAAAVQSKVEQEARAAAEVAARRDRAMAESYSTEDDLRRAFGERIGVMDETIKASRLVVEGRRQSLISLLGRAGENELSGKPVPKKAAENIQTQHELLLRQKAMLADQLAERELIDEDLAAALERYHAMKKSNDKG